MVWTGHGSVLRKYRNDIDCRIGCGLIVGGEGEVIARVYEMILQYLLDTRDQRVVSSTESRKVLLDTSDVETKDG